MTYVYGISVMIGSDGIAGPEGSMVGNGVTLVVGFGVILGVGIASSTIVGELNLLAGNFCLLCI